MASFPLASLEDKAMATLATRHGTFFFFSHAALVCRRDQRDKSGRMRSAVGLLAMGSEHGLLLAEPRAQSLCELGAQRKKS